MGWGDIPQELKAMRQWVCWAAIEQPQDKDGKVKIDKLPVKTNGKNASSSDHGTWHSWNDVCMAFGTKAKVYNRHKRSEEWLPLGIGFMFANGVCGIDIDNKQHNAQWEDRTHKEIIPLIDSYTELSPSGTGYHILFKCDISRLPTRFDVNKVTGEAAAKLSDRYYQKNDPEGLECYFPGLTNRFFTMTGKTVHFRGLETRTDAALEFLERYMKKPQQNRSNGELHKSDIALQETEVIDRLRRSRSADKFSTLYDRGDISYYGFDASRADLALCNMIAFYTQDANTIDSVFRSSALMRDKWHRPDYSSGTINKALNGLTATYNPSEAEAKKK